MKRRQRRRVIGKVGRWSKLVCLPVLSRRTLESQHHKLRNACLIGRSESHRGRQIMGRFHVSSKRFFFLSTVKQRDVGHRDSFEFGHAYDLFFHSPIGLSDQQDLSQTNHRFDITSSPLNCSAQDLQRGSQLPVCITVGNFFDDRDVLPT
jgi:hypothetical protein